MTQEEIKLKSTEELHQLLIKYKEIETQSDLNQYVRKILINACYGAIGNKHFPLYNPDIADAITSFGRYSIQTMTSHVVDNINKQMPFVKLRRSLNDTDSGHFSVPGLVDKYLESVPNASIQQISEMVVNFEKQFISPLLKESTKNNFDLMNDKELLMALDCETIADTEIISGKKRYAMRQQYIEGTYLSHPKYKIVGLDIKRSSTPALMRKKLEEALHLLFDGDNKSTLDYITKLEAEYYAGKFSLNEIAIPTGISDIDKFDGGNLSVPIHVRASLLHNELVRTMKLDRFSEVCSGDKIKWVYLKPNKYNTNVIAFNDIEFLNVIGLADKVDLRLMFEKTFTNSIEKLIESVGWQTSATAMVMDSLF